MFSSRNRRRLAAGLAAASLALGATAATAEMLVVRSIGPSAKLYPPGRSLADSASVTLQASDQLTLLDGRGTRTLKGPGSFDLAAPGATVTSAGSRFAALVGTRSTQRARIGAVRSVSSDAPHSPNMWYVDASRSGTMCVADPAALMLWRANSASEAQLKVAGAGGQSAIVAFASGQSAAAWPAAMPVTNGARYALGAGAARASIRFALVGGSEGLESTAATLIRNGCDAQLDLLVNVLSLPDNSAPRS